MALASDRPTLGKWKWKFPQLAEISDSGRTCATLLLEYFRYWFYNVNRRWLIGSSWGRWNFATIEVKCSLSLRMETCFERWWWEIVNWVSKVRINVWDGSCKTHFWTPRKWSRLRLDHFLGVQKCVLQLPSHTLILTLDTDLEKDTPIIPVIFWIQFHPTKCVLQRPSQT